MGRYSAWSSWHTCRGFVLDMLSSLLLACFSICSSLPILNSTQLPVSYRLLKFANIFTVPLLSLRPDFLPLLAFSGELLLQYGMSLSLTLWKANINDFRPLGGAIHCRETAAGILVYSKETKPKPFEFPCNPP
jgi:hypothetical protein